VDSAIALRLVVLVRPRAYAEIVRVDGRVSGLWLLDPLRMRIERDAMRRKVYRYTLPSGEMKIWAFDASQPPILDLQHPSPVQQCRDLIGTALALQTYTGRFFAAGGRPAGVLQAAGAVSEPTLTRLRATWESIHAKVENAHKVAILEGGLEFKPLSSANDDAQLNELQQALRTEIAAAFRVPVWRVGDMSNANYSNMEASERAFVSDALDPYFTCWEEAIRRDLLTVRQYSQFSVTFDRSSLIRSDTKSLHESLAVGRQAGWYSANDIRRKLGENPIPADAGGDSYLINTALAPITRTDDDAA
jgi:HK97 family phage portal protein